MEFDRFMKMSCFGVDISDNDVSCGIDLINDVRNNLYRIEEAGALFARLTNITGDDIVIAAAVEDDELECVNREIYEVLHGCALGFDDLNGVGETPGEAGEGISYACVDLDSEFYPDVIIMAFDTYCGEEFVDDVAVNVLAAARGIRSVADSATSVVENICEIPGVGYVSGQTDDPIVVAAVEDVRQVGVIAGAMTGAAVGYKNTYLVRSTTPANVVPPGVIFTVTALLNSNVIDLAGPLSHNMRILDG